MRVAVLNDRNVVENIIVADEAFSDAHLNEWVNVDEKWCDIGATYDPNTGVFTPAPPAPEDPPADVGAGG
jgi:hypothetical protein